MISMIIIITHLAELRSEVGFSRKSAADYVFAPHAAASLSGAIQIIKKG